MLIKSMLIVYSFRFLVMAPAPLQAFMQPFT